MNGFGEGRKAGSSAEPRRFSSRTLLLGKPIEAVRVRSWSEIVQAKLCTNGVIELQYIQPTVMNEKLGVCIGLSMVRV